MIEAMTPSRGYLLRALNDWIVDNQCTPYVVVDATMDTVRVPGQFVKNGQIVLNINPAAVRMLEIGNESLSFEARFAGKAERIFAPINAVMAIYAKENGRGMVFGWENDPADEPQDAQKNEFVQENAEQASLAKKSANKPRLKVIK